MFVGTRYFPKGSSAYTNKHWGSYNLNHRELTRILDIRELSREAKIWEPGNLASAGIPGENDPFSGLSAIAVWLWLALRALRPLILVYILKRGTPQEKQSPVPLRP